MRKARNDEDRFTIGELSNLTGVSIETIRYYERVGLLPRPPRTHGGHRAFGTEICRTLAFIKRARELGFGLNEIRTLLSLRDSKATCTDVRTIAIRHLENVRSKLRDLQTLESSLADAVARCTNDDSGNCAFLTKLDGSCCAGPPDGGCGEAV